MLNVEKRIYTIIREEYLVNSYGHIASQDCSVESGNEKCCGSTFLDSQNSSVCVFGDEYQRYIRCLSGVCLCGQCPGEIQQELAARGQQAGAD